MKANRIGWIVLLLGLVWTAGLKASAKDDYRVIKNAVAGAAASRAEQKSALFFKVQVTEMNGKHEVVKLTLPISLVEVLINSCADKRLQAGDNCHIDIRRVWKDLLAAGPLALVEIEDHGEMVKIWLE